jgi:hypothetical protein
LPPEATGSIYTTDFKWYAVRDGPGTVGNVRSQASDRQLKVEEVVVDG